MFDWMVIGQIVPVNPASSVRGPKHVVKRGKTPVLKAEQARLLLDSIDISSVSGLRDRALIGVMVFSFARVSAVTRMRVEDYYQNVKRWWLRLHEKGGKRHEVPAHHNAEAYVDAYLEAAGIAGQKKKSLFRTIDKHRQLTDRPMYREDVLRMIKRYETHHLEENGEIKKTEPRLENLNATPIVIGKGQRMDDNWLKFIFLDLIPRETQIYSARLAVIDSVGEEHLTEYVLKYD